VLTKHAVVVPLVVIQDDVSDPFVDFQLAGDISDIAVALDLSTWQEMGSPDEVTVTVQPGNALEGQG